MHTYTYALVSSSIGTNNHSFVLVFFFFFFLLWFLTRQSRNLFRDGTMGNFNLRHTDIHQTTRKFVISEWTVQTRTYTQVVHSHVHKKNQVRNVHTRTPYFHKIFFIKSLLFFCNFMLQPHSGIIPQKGISQIWLLV